MENKITLPYKFSPRKYQLNFLRALDNGIKRAIWVVHRRGGKDKTCWNYLIKKAFEHKATYFYLAPTYKQGKKIIWENIGGDGFRLLDHIPKEIIKNKNETELKIELINGSYIQIIGTDNIDSIMGSNPYGVVFTEFSLQQSKSWDYIRPILAENGGWAIFNFTPRGTNHAYKLLQSAKTNPKWFTEVLTVEDTHAINEEELKEERKQMPGDLYDQEYLCKFVDGASQFFRGVDKVVYDDAYEVPEELHEYKFGIDLAKSGDYSVITPFDLNTFKVGRQDRFNQIDYTYQKEKIKARYFQYRNPVTTMDGTGIGDPIFDDLFRDMNNLQKYVFTERSRMDLLTNLQLKIEQQIIKIPNDPILIEELKSFEYVISDKGRVSARCPDSMHDDMVMSLALAVYNTPNRPLEVVNPYQEYRRNILSDQSLDDRTGYYL